VGSGWNLNCSTIEESRDEKKWLLLYIQNGSYSMFKMAATLYSKWQLLHVQNGCYSIVKTIK
jgi:hypothetical protein